MGFALKYIICRLGVLVGEYEFIFENSQLEHDASEGCQRIPEKDRVAFLRDLRQVHIRLSSNAYIFTPSLGAHMSF